MNRVLIALALALVVLFAAIGLGALTATPLRGESARLHWKKGNAILWRSFVTGRGVVTHVSRAAHDDLTGGGPGDCK